MTKEIELSELAQMMALLDDAIATEDINGANQVYSMILYHIAYTHNPKLVEAIDQLIKDI